MGSPGEYHSTTKPSKNLIMMDNIGDSTEFMIRELAIEDLLHITEVTSSVAPTRSRMTFFLLAVCLIQIYSST